MSAGTAMTEAISRTRRAELLLALGAATGLLMAGASVLERAPAAGGGTLPADVAAVVNGVPISRSDYEAALALPTAAGPGASSDAQRRAVLDRLIDEELLLEEGISLGVPRHEDALRAGLISAVRESVIATALAAQPTPDEVEAFYRANAATFARVTTAHLRHVWVDGARYDSTESALAAARQVTERLRRGEPFAIVAAELGDATPLAVPDHVADRSDLQLALGPTAVERAFALPGGGVIDPMQRGTSYLVVQVVALGPAVVPPLDQIGDRVRNEMGRRIQVRAIREHVAGLRAGAEIRVGAP